jgi:hypothetical protein
MSYRREVEQIFGREPHMPPGVRESEIGGDEPSHSIGRRVNLTKKIGSFWAGTEFDVVRCYRDSRVGTCLLDLECGNGVLTRVSLFDVERI